MEQAAVFGAVADPQRRAMLLLVRDEPRSVSEIAGHFQISQQAVSQHLAVLREAGLVDVRPDGRRRLYVIRPDGFGAIEQFLAELWPAKLQALKQTAEARNRRRRHVS